VIPANSVRYLSADFDPNLTYFCEVLGYFDDDEIQQEVQNALQFFSEMFGLRVLPHSAQ